jgi:5-methylcytosine-specific restriction endonuclease McrA
MTRGSVARADRGESEWVLAHRELSRLAALRARGDAEEGRGLLAALRAGAHVFAGFGSFGEYVGHLFGYSPRFTHEKLRVAEALEKLPQLAAALESGALHWSGLRELTRVATPATEAAWLEVARGKSARQLEALVSGASPGDAPGAARSPAARRHVLRFEVRGETLAAVREAFAQLRRTSDPRLGDDAALLAMARAVLGGPSDGGRASYQISLSVCPECDRGVQHAAGEPVAVSPEVVAMARCDARTLGLAASSANDNQVGGSSEKEASRTEPAAHRPVVVADDLVAARGAVEHGSAWHASGQTDPHVGSEVRRTTQSIPPALRRRVLARDGRVCRVPGCGNNLFLDLHHITPRAEGGANTAINLISLCGVHHRAIHVGSLLILGSAGAATFQHADGSAYGQTHDAGAIDLFAKVFSGLRNLGFPERDTRALVEQLRHEGSIRSLDLQALLRVALQRLAPPARR